MVPNKQFLVRSAVEERNMCKILRTRNAALVTLSLDAGLRRAEATGLTMEMLHLETGLLHLPAELTKINKGRVYALGESTVTGALQDWLDVRTRIASSLVKAGKNVPDNVFLSEKGRALTPNGWPNEFTDLVSRANLSRRITTHSMRRTNSIAMDLVDVDASMAQLGHSSKRVHDLYNEFGPAHIAKLKLAKERAGLFGPSPSVGDK